ncbi:MAG: hypothetical protein ACJ768_04040 [Gaiellaceae bacterium]
MSVGRPARLRPLVAENRDLLLDLPCERTQRPAGDSLKAEQ